MDALVTHEIPRPLSAPPTHLPSSRALRIALILTIVIAAILRVWGLRQGIPFTLGVDEPEVVERAVRMLKTGDFNPHFFDYPSLYIYVQTAMAIVRFVWGALHSEWASLAQAPTSAFYLTGRAVTAAMGTATVYFLYRCGRKWDEAVGVLAAALLAVMPLHVRESHFVLTDVPTTLFVVLTLWFSLEAHESRRLRAFVAAGAMAGLAGAMKYNGGIVVLLPLAACWSTPRTAYSRLTLSVAVVAACGLAFLAGAPYTLLDLPTFLDQFARLASEYRTGGGGTPPAITYLKHLRNALEWPAAVLAAIGLLMAIWRTLTGPHRVKWGLIAVFPILYFWFIARQHIVFARYLMPMVPFVALLEAAAIVALVRATARSRRSPRSVQAAAVVLALLAFAPQVLQSYGFDREASKTWTSALADTWIRANIPAGSTVVIESRNLLLGPRYKASNVSQLRDQTIDDYRRSGVDYLVASSQCFGPYFRNPSAAPAAYADYVRLFRETQEVARFLPSAEHPGSELRVLKVPR